MISRRSLFLGLAGAVAAPAVGNGGWTKRSGVSCIGPSFRSADPPLLVTFRTIAPLRERHLKRLYGAIQRYCETGGRVIVDCPDTQAFYFHGFPDDVSKYQPYASLNVVPSEQH